MWTRTFAVQTIQLQPADCIERMPELPDIAIYREALERRVVDRVLRRISIRSPFLIRTIDPPIDAAEGMTVRAITTVGKRVVLELISSRSDYPQLYLVFHLMIAGRLLWKPAGTKPTGKIDLAAFEFEPASPDGATLILTEASQLKRASLHVLSSREQLKDMDPGGIDPLACTSEDFSRVLRAHNRTLKRALTDPHTISGVGNAYSDEILHAARLSPISHSGKLSDQQFATLHAAMQLTLHLWTQRLRREFDLIDDAGNPSLGRFPGVGEITAFRPDFAVHGRFKKPCPVCGTKVARIVRADNEFNYCPTCQTSGKLLADRALSRLLKEDWGKEET